jgi:hypothetical protein
MALVAREVKDKRVLKLIRLFLQSGVMINGVYVDTEEGCPQGGPLSPLLSNIMLTEFDRELEKRGHKFCRYADDCNIYVKSKRAGERVIASAVGFLLGKLKLPEALADQGCVNCHSTDMIRQQRLNEKQWAASVTKMVGWGAEVPESGRDALIAYLVANFGPDNDRFEPVVTRPVGR